MNASERKILLEMTGLMRRMDSIGNSFTDHFLNENMCETATKWRQVVGPDEFYDILGGIPKGRIVTFGYVSAAKIRVPEGHKLNPVTKRMNKYADYAQLGKDLGEAGEVSGVIKLTTYQMPWQTEDSTTSGYKKWKDTRDALGDKYGLSFGKAKYAVERNKVDDHGGIATYKGHSYTNLNMKHIYPQSKEYFLVMSDGNLKAIDEKRLDFIPYVPDSTIDRLKAAGATEEEVAPLAEMQYQRFEHSHILFFSATPKDGDNAGLPSLFINTKLSDKLGDFTTSDPSKIIDLAKERYSRYTGFNVSDTEN